MSPRYAKGFPSLAAFIASDTDKTTLIFRRFDRLAARNLLHLQAKVARLERLIDERDAEDAKSGLSALQYLRNWDDFEEASGSDERQRERLELFNNLERTMKDYRKALLYESSLASLEQPSKKTLDAFSSKLVLGRNKEKTYPLLGGSCSNMLSDPNDLVALKTLEHRDRLTSFVQDHMAFLFQTGVKDGDISYASDSRIYHFVAWISIILSAFLLIGAIVGLYIVQSPLKRLIMIGIFTAAFAAGVGLLTNARRAELFAATAAYAAVLVVFVSGNLSGCSCKG